MEIKKLGNSVVELTLTLESAAIEEAYSKSIKDYAKKITMKGFRQGKAPVSLLESKFGAEIREEVTFKLMEDKLEESYKDMDPKDKPLPYCTPELQNEETLLPFTAGKDITFTVKYDVVPEVKLGQHTGLEIECEEAKVTAKQVNDEIERLRQQNAMVMTKEGPAAKGDIVTVDYAELDADGNKVEATKRDDFTFTVGSSYNFYKIDDEVCGMAKGDEKVIEKTYDDKSGMSAEYVGKTVKIQVVMKEVKVREVPELDDEFAQDIKDEYKTLDDLKKDTKKQLKEQADLENKGVRLDAVLTKILEGTEIAVPQSMVNAQLEEDWKNFVQRFGMPEAEVEKFMAANGGGKAQFLEARKDDTVSNLKKQLVLEQVKEEQNFEVTDAELEEELKKFGEDITKDNPNYDMFKSYAEDNLKFSKAQDYLLANNTFKAPAKKEAAAEEN